MKAVCILLLALPLLPLAAAEDRASGSLPSSVEHVQGPLSDKERASLELAKKWMETPEKPLLTPEGKVMYLYGVTLPTLFCTPLYTSDLELEAGERVRESGINLGDTVRWVASPAISGPDDALVTHVLLKPKDVGLTTTLVITTDRRTYHILLKSTPENWTPRLAFEYPAQIEKAWANYQATVNKSVEARTLPDTHQDMSKLDFAYSIIGDAEWKPVRVYNDGLKTYVQMPKAMAQTEAPALLVLGTDNKEQLVNYRLINDRFVVDQLFKSAELIAGVGRKQTKVKITRLN